MNAMVLSGAGVGLGLLLILRGWAPARPDIAVAIGQWQVARRRAADRHARGGQEKSRADRVGAWLADAFAKRGVELPKLQADLALLNRPWESFLSSLVLYAAGGFLLPAIAGAGVAALGMSLGLWIPAGAGLFFAAMLVVNEVNQVRTEADQRRKDVRRALGSYLDLVSMALAGGRGFGDALPQAAAIGSGWAFNLFAETVNTARLGGATLWRAMGDLGERYRVPELVALASSLELVGRDGAKIRDTLEAQADTLRRRQLAETHSEAEKKNESMTYALYFFVVGFVMLIFYPAFQLVLTT